MLAHADICSQACESNLRLTEEELTEHNFRRSDGGIELCLDALRCQAGNPDGDQATQQGAGLTQPDSLQPPTHRYADVRVKTVPWRGEDVACIVPRVASLSLRH